MEPIWHGSYPPGIPTHIDPSDPGTVTALLREAVQRYPDRTAVEADGRKSSYRALDELSDRFAGFLHRKLELDPGTRIALMCPNVPAFPIAFFGALKAGLVVVTVNPYYTAPELLHQLSDSGARVLVVAEPSLAAACEALPQSDVAHLIRIRGRHRADPAGLPAEELRHPRDVSEHDFDAVLANEADSPDLPTARPEDLALLQYTGGTTGRAKGAMLTHRNLVASVKAFEPFLGACDESAQEVVVTATPLYHILGLCVNCLTFLRRGGRMLLIENPRDLPGLVAALEGRPFSVITGVNTLFNGLLATPGFAELDFSRLRLCMGGGTPIQESVSRRWHSVTGHYIREGYGMSEAGGLTQTPRQQAGHRSTIGLPVPSLEVSLRDENGKEVAQGQPGELCVKGPSVTHGYWNTDAEAAEWRTEDGFFRTGDVAVMEADGYLRIVDRSKDLILVSGFNVYPSEVEAVATAAPGVFECACIGVADERTGEAVKLFVVPAPGQAGELSVDAVIDHCRARLARYKVPKQVRVVDALPKSAVGKILRRELREWA